MSDPESKSVSTEAERTPEEIRAGIDETREELGDTVAAATEKTDVKKQAKEFFAQQNPVAVAGALVGLLVLWRLLRR